MRKHKLDRVLRSINNELMGKLPYILLITVLVILSGSAGFFIGRTSSNSQTTAVSSEITKVQKIPVLANQTATLQGVVTKVSNTTLTLKSNTNQVAEFPLAKNFVVYTYTDTNRTAAASSEVKSIQINKDATFVLNLIENTYQIATITFLPK